MPSEIPCLADDPELCRVGKYQPKAVNCREMQRLRSGPRRSPWARVDGVQH